MSNELVDTWWNEENGRTDQDMEDGHQVYWGHVIDELDGTDFNGKSIIDIGCNQGGFLRHLCKHYRIKEGVGVDLAKKSVEVANQRRGDLPLSYRAVADLREEEDLRERFDYGISTSVIYLIKDLATFARQAHHCLKPGGRLFIDFADYDYLNSKAMTALREQIAAGASIPLQNNSLDSITAAFASEGFSVAIKRFAPRGFIPLSVPDLWYSSVNERLDFEYLRTYMFRMTKI